MTRDGLELTRRKILASVGAVGAAGAGAGLGTQAYFWDEESFTNNQVVAGELDMKVAATEYYSDWSSDEAALAGMAEDEASTDIRLPAPEGWDDAMDIALDLNDDYDGLEDDVYAAFVKEISSNENGNSYNTVNGGIAAASDGLCGSNADADGPVIIDIGDVKPGDFGGAQFAFELCDNPGYVWLQGGLVDANENGVTEPEGKDDDERADVVELLDRIQVAYGVGNIQDSTAFEDTDAGFQPTNQMSLREFLTLANNVEGIPLEGDIDAEDGGGTGRNCFSGSPDDGTAVRQVSVIWWLPIDHGNEVQGDSVTFDLGFYTEQCRHNDGSDLSTGLVGYWPLDTVGDGTAVDISSNGNNGTIVGGVSSVDGKVGKSALFTDRSDYININGFIDSSAEQSRFAWVKPTGGSGGGYPRVIHQGNNLELAWKQSSNEWAVWDGNDWYTFATAPDNVWQHVGVVWDGTDLLGYKNGQKFNLAANGGTPSSATITIGANPSPGGDRIEGRIDDVRIYNRPLSDQEVTDLYNNTN